MKDLFTQKNMIYAGLAFVTAIVAYSIINNSKKVKRTSITNYMVKKPLIISEEKSDFCGCGM